MFEKPQIKDVFDIDKTIAEHGNRILLLGGVGSGKSTWVSEVLANKGSVLFITSRKAKVLEDEKCTCFSEVFEWYKDGNQVLLTNAKLAKLIESLAADKQKDIDEFIDHFDYIVIDEVHSLATDSAFAPSCATVLSFIEYAADNGKVVVCMTGTPEPVQKYLEFKGWYIEDLIDVCDYVHPKRVSLIHNKNAAKYIKEEAKNKKVIYFANHLKDIIKLCKELLDKNVFNATEIAITVAKGKEKKLFDDLQKSLTHEGDADVIKGKSEEAYADIIEKKLLPENCKILFSTSVLKEGVNIKNPHIAMFCENHVLANLIQFFGRAREGSEEVYVIDDSSGYSENHNEFLLNYAIKTEADAASAHYKQYIETSPFKEDEHRKLTTHVTKNPYIYFDYIKNRYSIFALKYLEEIRLEKQWDWQDKLLNHCKRYGINYRWFDSANERNILFDLAKRNQKFYIEDKGKVLNLLYSAYKIKAKQPKRINEKLIEKKVPIKIITGKDNTADNRNRYYWQLVYLKEQDEERAIQEMRKLFEFY